MSGGGEEEEVSVLEVGGRRRQRGKDGGRDQRKIERGETYTHQSNPRSLQRQDTFVLEEEGKHHGKRAESSYGILTIMERAERMCPLTSEVREYLGSHWRMLGKEVTRLEGEQKRLAKEKERQEGVQSKVVRGLQLQLDREMAKTRALLNRQKRRGGGDEDTITISGVTFGGEGSRPSSSQAASPLPQDVVLLTKKVRVYRNQASQQKMELKQLRELLEREVGVGLETMQAGGWKGRAEQVARLQTRLEELETKEGEGSQGSAESDLSEHYLADSESGEEQEKRALPRLSSRRGEREEHTLHQAAEVERARLGELVQLLTTRLKAAEERVAEAEVAAREEVRRGAKLRSALERCRLQLREAGVPELPASRGVSARSGRLGEEEELEKVGGEVLRWEVARQREEARALRRELGEARGAREEMVRIYQRMLEDTRQVFRQGLEE